MVVHHLGPDLRLEAGTVNFCWFRQSYLAREDSTISHGVLLFSYHLVIIRVCDVCDVVSLTESKSTITNPRINCPGIF